MYISEWKKSDHEIERVAAIGEFNVYICYFIYYLLMILVPGTVKYLDIFLFVCSDFDDWHFMQIYTKKKFKSIHTSLRTLNAIFWKKFE